ncbi:class I SAM-dependent methyltransferase [Desulfosarcina cetonica]
MARIVLAPKREKSLINRHPWIFSGAVASVAGEPQAGDTVEVHAAGGQWLGRAAWSPHSQIRARVWTFDRKEVVDEAFFMRRLKQAMDLRRSILPGSDTTACRLVAAESDGLPGLIVDRYDCWLVCQFLTTGSEHWKKTIVETLRLLVPDCRGIYERSDVDVRKKEGLGLTTGELWGAPPPEQVVIHENGCRFLVDLRSGHKTGFYLDQRDNRAHVATFARGARMLNCFAYTGGFAVAALKAGADHVVNIDTSAPSLALAEANIARNGLDSSRVENVVGDVFTRLRTYVREKRSFDLIVLDPPKFVTGKGDLMRAARGYKDINRLAFELLDHGGALCTFSCSGLMERHLFQKIVADAALDAKRPARVTHWLSQSPDHPMGLNFPEGSYLKGLVCRV